MTPMLSSRKSPRARRLANPIYRRARPAPVLYLGLDVHNDSIAESLAPSDWRYSE